MNNENKIADSPKEWWELIKADYKKYDSNAHLDDRMSLTDYASECGLVYGYKTIFGEYGDLEIVRK